MTDFAEVVRRHMERRGMSLRATAAAAHYDPGMLSKVLAGKRNASPYLAARLDEALEAGGEIRGAVTGRPTGGKPKPAARKGTAPSAAVLALQAAMTGDPAELNIAADGLAELVRYYAHAVAVMPSAGVYAELLSARTFAGTQAGRTSPKGRPDLTVSAGWLSSLLAISATDLGDHAAAVVWCADAERKASEAGYPELLGWSALTRAAIAYYQGDPARSAAIAGQGQAMAPAGSAAQVKLAAQEMRCMAMLGDFEGMADARARAAAALARITPGTAPAGIYSLQRAADPPYTATSLLLAGRYVEAAAMTRAILASAYPSRPTGDQPTHYARTLLILALAAAGLGDVDEAAATGTEALSAGRVVWPTMVLAGRLARQLDATSPGSPHATGFRERYMSAGSRLALTAAPARESG
jgi:transcriptional regulator with XRE-family HTH domain